MAKIKNNLIIHGLSGTLGKQVVVRRMQNGEYVLSAAPNRSSHELTDAQKEPREKFRQAGCLLLIVSQTANAIGDKQLAMGNGQSAQKQWAIGNGQWAMGNGQWAISNPPQAPNLPDDELESLVNEAVQYARSR